MRRIWTVAVAVLLTATACTNFLDAPKAVADPNNPTVASRNQLFVGVQANTFGYYEGYVPMLVCMWMQQCAGINSRFVQTEGEYGITAGSLDFTFSGVYVGGGLIGIRAVEASAEASGDKLYKGIAEVHEAMIMMPGATYRIVRQRRTNRMRCSIHSCRSMMICSRYSTKPSPISMAGAPDQVRSTWCTAVTRRNGRRRRTR